MKRVHMARALTILLALTLLLLCACTGEEPSDTSKPNSGAASTTPSAPESTDIVPEVVDLDGRTINVLCWMFGAGGTSIRGYTGEIIYSTEDNASAIDVQKKAVIDYVEQQYNCTIDGILDGGDMSVDTIGNAVRNMVTTGTYDYDIVFQSSGFMANLASEGVLTNLNSVNTIHLENSWWDQNAVQQLSIDNQLYYVNGDINTYDDLGTWCVIFNKSLKARLGIEEDFYQTVRDGNWTLDHFMELCQGITQDTNGDGVINEFDQWAFGTEKYNVFVQVLGGGLHVAEKDNQDLPYLTISNNPQRIYSALDKIIEFYLSKETMVADSGNYSQYSNPWEATVHKAFVEGRELFYMCGLINLAGFRDMEDDIGVLPIPKTFAEQDGYYHTVSTTNSSYMAIPLGVPDVENLGLVIEAIAMKSQELVTPAFYDTQLKYRDLRDNESGEVLDLLFATRSFDLGPVFNWGGLMAQMYTIDPNYVSRFESVLSAAEIAVEETIQMYKDLE